MDQYESIRQKIVEAQSRHDFELEQWKKGNYRGKSMRDLTHFNQLSDWSWELVWDDDGSIYKFCEETGEKYQFNYKELFQLTRLVIYREITLGEFPLAIETTCETNRKQALQAAIRIGRHVLKQVSEHNNIGNVEAYMEE